MSRHSKVISQTDRHLDTQTDYENITSQHTQAVKSALRRHGADDVPCTQMERDYSNLQMINRWKLNMCVY